MDPLLLWGLGLLAAGFLVLFAELFIPSAGVLLMSSGVLAVSGVVCLYRYDTVWGVIGTLAVIVGGPIIGLFGLKIMPHTPFGRRLILGDVVDAEDRAPKRDSAEVEALRALVGREGEVVSDLRPIGVVRVEGKRFDARSELGMLRAGQRVAVSRIDGSELVVRPL
ncbi:MAG: NfeD family protein [Phycisphaerales bacterium]